MSDLMRIGSSAMSAAYAQLQTTGQNIANASTPGYVRREVVLQEAGSSGPSGFMGRGVDAVAVQRVYDQFLTRESASSKASAAPLATSSARTELYEAFSAWSISPIRSPDWNSRGRGLAAISRNSPSPASAVEMRACRRPLSSGLACASIGPM